MKPPSLAAQAQESPNEALPAVSDNWCRTRQWT